MAEITAARPTKTAPDNDGQARRAVMILAWGQAVLGAQLPVQIILAGLVGAMLAHDVAFATVPITVMVLGSMVGAPILSTIMGRIGRRPGFLIAASAGALGAWINLNGILAQDFQLFLIGNFVSGMYWAGHNLYRFAAADLASPEFRPKAISWVMAAGLVSAILGPEIAKYFGDALAPVPHAGAYQALIWLNLLGALPLLFLDIPLPRKPKDTKTSKRPLREILSEPRVPVAMLCAMVSYGLMNLMMTSTPLAMIACGFITAQAAGVVQGHVLSMYIPSFFTGGLIARFGATRIIATGLGAIALAAGVAASGITLVHFYAGLILLGIGWNFGFIGATSMLADAVAPEDRARMQGLNDFCVMAFVGVASASSGVLLSAGGWAAVQIAAVPMLTLAGGALIWLTLRRPAAAA
ncbi:MAG: MFS transporter [Pseudomonadota bacterium]